MVVNSLIMSFSHTWFGKQLRQKQVASGSSFLGIQIKTCSNDIKRVHSPNSYETHDKIQLPVSAVSGERLLVTQRVAAVARHWRAVVHLTIALVVVVVVEFNNDCHSNKHFAYHSSHQSHRIIVIVVVDMLQVKLRITSSLILPSPLSILSLHIQPGYFCSGLLCLAMADASACANSAQAPAFLPDSVDYAPCKNCPRRRRPQREGACCRACQHNEIEPDGRRHHTNKCNLANPPVNRTGNDDCGRNTRSSTVLAFLPESDAKQVHDIRRIVLPRPWCVQGFEYNDIIGYLVNRFTNISEQWIKTATFIADARTARRHVRIHARRLDSVPNDTVSLDVARGEFHTDARGPYDLGAETGSSFVVQAHMVLQVNVAKAVEHAVFSIETFNLEDFAFACDGGTHRSVCCALLLAMLAYPKAEVCLHTPRTRDHLKRKLAIATD